MENLENLMSLAKELPKEVVENAVALVTEMGSTIEGIGDEPIAWKPGFLRLVQGTTDRSSIPRDARIGDLVIGEHKLDAPFKFIPFRIWTGRQYWDPDQTNNKMLCWSPDAKLGFIGRECKGCPHAEWKEEGGSDCSKNIGVMAISADLTRVFTVTFAKSNYKVGLELEGLMKKAGVAPYARVYGLGSATSATAKNVENFKIEVLDDKSRRTPEAYLPFLKELFDRITADRKSMIDAFYEGALKRKDQLAIAGGEQQALISNNAGESNVTIEDDAGDKKSPLAKSYSI